MADESKQSLPRRAWEAWSVIDTASNLPSWWRWAKGVIAPGAPLGLSWWASTTTNWPTPLIFAFGLGVFGVTLFVLNQISVRAWLAREAEDARHGIRTTEPPVRVWRPDYTDDPNVVISVTN